MKQFYSKLFSLNVTRCSIFLRGGRGKINTVYRRTQKFFVHPHLAAYG